MRVLVDRGKREGEGEGEILLMRMGRREEERERWRLVMRMYWCFTGRKAACSCWPCSKLCARIGEKPTAEPIERGRRWRKVEERENERVGEGERADDRERERESTSDLSQKAESTTEQYRSVCRCCKTALISCLARSRDVLICSVSVPPMAPLGPSPSRWRV